MLALRASIPALGHLQIGLDQLHDARSWDLVLIMRFESVEALRARNIPFKGIAFIGDENRESESIIIEKSGARRLGRLPRVDPLARESLAAAFAAHFRLDDFA